MLNLKAMMIPHHRAVTVEGFAFFAKVCHIRIEATDRLKQRLLHRASAWSSASCEDTGKPRSGSRVQRAAFGQLSPFLGRGYLNRSGWPWKTFSTKRLKRIGAGRRGGV